MGLHPVGSPRNLAQKKIDADGFLKVYDHHIILYLRYGVLFDRELKCGFRTISVYFAVPKEKHSIEYLKKVKHLVVIG